MTYSIDPNILLFSVDTGSVFHKKASDFMKTVLYSDETCCLTWETLYGFMRISTNSSIYKSPLSPQAASDNINELINHPHIEILSSDKESWQIFEKLNKTIHLRGNLVPDAVLASILESNGIHRLYTHDRDFWKFPYLKPIDPFAD
jgi:toxin-antitoxin system PIN domain toxin